MTAWEEVVTFTVLGVPAPQGSKTAFKGRVVEGGSASGRAKHRAWREAVAWEAHRVWADRELPPVNGPCNISAEFVLPRPSSARKGDRWHTKRPDLDKLARSLLDSLTDAGVLCDDARVCALTVVKMLADREDPWTGAVISVNRLEGP